MSLLLGRRLGQIRVCTAVYTHSWLANYCDGMSEIGIRQLRVDVAANVRRAGAGEHLVVTIAGRPVAQLGPLGAPEGQARLSDLIARGLVVAPRRAGTFRPSDPVPVRAANRIDRLLREIR